MSAWQRVIKYGAIFLAGCLIVVIITCGLRVVVGLVDIFIPNNQKPVIVSEIKDEKEENEKEEDEKEEDELVNSENIYEDVENLKVASGVYKIHIIEDSSLKKGIKVDLSDISSDCEVKYIKETKTVEIEQEEKFINIFGSGRTKIKGSIDIYVAKETDFNEVDVKVGVGNVSIENINTTHLNIECGVGTFSCDEVKAEMAEIRGGVGNVDCEDVTFEGLNIEGGVGDISVEGKLYGKIEISAGMGDMDIEIDGKRSEYSWSVETGLGSVTIDGEKCGDTNFDNNSQNNLIDIKGGIGAVSIEFN